MSQQKTGCVFGWFANLFGGASTSPGTAAMPKVMVSTKFVTPAEADFFRVLVRVVGGRGHVLAQVSLRQLLFFPGNSKTPGRGTWENKVRARSIDFLVCDRATLRPLVAVELDDATHASARREARDDEVERVLAAAGLPLVNVLTSRAYETRELEAALAPYLVGTASRPQNG